MSRRSVLAVTWLALILAACTGPVVRNTFPPAGVTPQPPGDATEATRRLVVDALAAEGLQAVETARAYRPAEGARLAAAPRTVLQAVLPDDPTHGYIVVYALDSPAAAQAAAEDQATYAASSIGKAYYPPGTQFVIRVVGSTVVFFQWLPANSPDERTAEVARVLSTLGTGVPVPA